MVGVMTLCMLAITRVQNAAEHQSLIYLPEYITGILLAMCVADSYAGDRGEGDSTSGNYYDININGTAKRISVNNFRHILAL